ncbi:hypothetical protein ACGFNU_19330 [Spirillospora sp. NPDC048911]|uniref:hypothetical protein n=1 Tax=Spirillospora sp. NPDC048911 TaxID=3364527 RepID=UPI0037200B42
MKGEASPRYSTGGRLEQIGQRLRELQARGRELREYSASQAARSARLPRSAELVRMAELRAEAAAEAAEAAYYHAGDVHDRAAALHDRLAESGIGDTGRHRQKAREHRSLAEADRKTGGSIRAGTTRRPRE